MSIYEYDFDEHMGVIREESYEDGFAEGEARIKAATARNLAGRGLAVSDIAEIVDAETGEVEQWLLEGDNR